MKRVTLILVIESISLLVCAQRLENVESDSWITRYQHGINHTALATGINSQFMKSGIGLNWELIESLPKDVIHFDRKNAMWDSVFIFDGIPYNRYSNLISDKYRPRLITLMDVKKEYVNNFPLRSCLFMIDNVLITRDPRAFRIDRDYIASVRGFTPQEIETLKPGWHLNEGCYVIRIYTKSKDYLNRLKLLDDADDTFRFLLKP